MMYRMKPQFKLFSYIKVPTSLGSLPFSVKVFFVGFCLLLTTPIHAKDVPLAYAFRTIKIQKGLVSSLSFGINHQDGDSIKNTTFFQWEGEGSYFYKPWISGGAYFRILSGNPTSTSTKIENRYLFFARGHYRRGNFGLYAGPMLGLHILNFQADTSTQEGNQPLSESEKLKEIGFENFTYGAELGTAYRMNDWLGLNSGLKLEHTPEDDEKLARFVGGGSLNLLKLIKYKENTAQAFFLNLEYQFSLVKDALSDSKILPARNRESVILLGFSVAF